jgi:TorA maturation chaperone TorD
MPKTMINDPDFNLQELTGAAQARIAFYSFLNLHFSTLVDAAFVTRLMNGELAAILEEVKQDETEDEDIRAGASLMLDYLEKSRYLDLAKLTEELGVDRTRLYRGAAKGYGPPPPNEMVWNKDTQDFGVLQTIARLYREAGMQPSTEVKERLDYISVELDFLRELAQREMLAWQSGDMQEAADFFEKQRVFMRDHVAAWVPDYIEEAFKHANTDFYRGHLLMLRGFLQSEQQRLDLIAETLSG